MIKITDGRYTLVEGTDYEVKYTNNVNAGTATITITGKGNYTGTITETFIIEKATPTVGMTETNGEVRVNVEGSFGVTADIPGTITVTSSDESHVIIVSGDGENVIVDKETTITYRGVTPTETDETITVVFKPTDSDNYENVTIVYTVSVSSKVLPELVVTPVSGSVDYNGTATFEVEANTAGKLTVTSGNTTYVQIVSGNGANISTNGTVLVTFKGLKATTTATTIDILFEPTDTTNFVEATATYTVTAVNKISPTLTADPDRLPLLVGNSGEIEITYIGDGELSAKSDKVDIATATLDGKVINVIGMSTGNATITVTATEGDNYLGKSITIPVVVNKKALDSSDVTITLNETEYTYDGTAKKPGVTIKDTVRNVTLLEGSSYTLTYTNNINAGTATVTITGMRDYTGTIEKTFKINPKVLTVIPNANQSKAYGATDPKLIYTFSGNVTGQTPGFTGALSREPGETVAKYAIKLGTLKLQDNGTFLASNYSIKLSDTVVTFEIKAKTVAGLDVTLDETEYTYDGTAKTPTETVKDGTSTLKEGTDYTVTYTDNVNAGTVTVTITGKGNYSGTTTTTFEIAKKTLTVTPNANQSKVYGAADPELTYTFSGNITGQTPGFNGALSRAEGESEGKYAITLGTLALKDNGTFLAKNYNLVFSGTVVNFTITSKAISGLDISLGTTEYTYDGTAKNPNVIIKDGTTTLKEGTDYTLTYTDNVNAGTATVTITGKGNYEGTTTKTYIINKKVLTVIPNVNQSKVYGAADPVLTYTYSGNVSGQTPKFSGALSRTAGEKAGTYPIKLGTLALIDNGTFLRSNYKLELSSTTVNFTIKKATPTVTLDETSGEVRFNAEESFEVSSSIPGKIIVTSGDTNYVTIVDGNGDIVSKDESATVTYKGVAPTETDVTIKVTFVPNDSDNYETIEILYTVKVTPKVLPEVALTPNKGTVVVGFENTFDVTANTNGKLTVTSGNTTYVSIVSGNGSNVVANDPFTVTYKGEKTTMVETVITVVFEPTDTEVYDKVTLEYVVTKVVATTAPQVSGPNEVVVGLGETATYKVVASGGMPDTYTYTWQVSTDNGKTWTNVENGNGSSYTTPAATYDMDSTLYRCVVSNGIFNVASKAVRFIIDPNDMAELPLDIVPIGRYTFINGNVISKDGDKNVVELELVIKATSPLKTLSINGEEININSSAKQSIDNASVTKNAYIEIKNASGEIAEYSYSFYVTVNANGIYTATFEDTKGHKNKVTQTIDTFKAEALEVKYTVQDPTVYREYAVVTFSANRPVKLVSPESYKDIIDKVGNGEYANKYTLNVYDEMSDIVFEFVDKSGYTDEINVSVTLNGNKDIRLTNDAQDLGKLSISQAYDLAQEMESKLEMTDDGNVQSRYGVSSAQTDMFMSRARDVGAAVMLANASRAKAYDAVLPKDIEGEGTSEFSRYGISGISNEYVAAFNSNASGTSISQANAKYVDVLRGSRLNLYKGLLLSGFSMSSSSEPYVIMIGNTSGNNISNTASEGNSFRVTIVNK